jgi:hypothetical protein
LFENPIIDFINQEIRAAQKGRDQLCLLHKQTKLPSMPIWNPVSEYQPHKVRTLWSAQSMLYYQLSDHFRPHWGLHQHHGQSDNDKSESDAYEQLKEDPVDVQMHKSPMIQGLWAVKIPRDGQQTPDPAPPSRPCSSSFCHQRWGTIWSLRMAEWRWPATGTPKQGQLLSYRRQHRLGSHQRLVQRQRPPYFFGTSCRKSFESLSKLGALTIIINYKDLSILR